ncbi:glutathione S-transferase 1-1-like isoform X2 [Penaeus japonicus]|uniref:glutathione S-transferase 1-1-like isoform X2 n=1 Tax=Penaeus japonicus TaxID=27405 RepID=UPI001C71727F|nr:glutathione S-transferase 1-1-like isoform X2 [Penaeus japonicus]
MPDFYYAMVSPPCRAALLTAKAVGVNLNLKTIDLSKEEHKKPEFLAINPQHTVPTLVDGDLTMWESRAICTYLASQYGKSDSFYPSNPKTRARVEHMLYFDMGTLYKRFGEYAYPVVFRGEQPNPEKLESLHEALGWLNDALAGHDCVLAASVSTFEAGGIDLGRHSRVATWLANCKTSLPGYDEANAPGAAIFGSFAKPALSK